MMTEEELIVSLLGSIVLGKQNPLCLQTIANGINWPRFKELISYHEIQPLLYPVVQDCASLFPEAIITFLKNNYFYNLIINQKLLDEFSHISEVFSLYKITIVPLKGVALLRDVYDHIPSRPMADIDVLVQKEQLPRAREILADLGFVERLEGLSQSYWLEKQCHIPFLKKQPDEDAIALDLHFGLDFQRGKTKVLPELWDRVSGGILSPEDTLFSLALHQRRFGKVLCLKNVVDAGLILKKYQNNIDWHYIIAQAKIGRMRSTMFFFLEQVKNLFGSEIDLPCLTVLCPGYFKKRLVRSFIKKNLFLDSSVRNGNKLYLKSHFLLYDSFFEPAKYIVNIPQEQFAKFYKLEPYSKRTVFLYNNRMWYILYRLVK